MLELDLDALEIPVRDYVLAHNRSGQLPYHNNTHLAGVAEVAKRLLLAEMSSTHQQVSAQEALNLLTAAWFHDVDHTGGTAPDSVNIALATLHAGEYLESVGRQEDIQQVCELIQSTQYPAQRAPQGILEQCLRDADLLQAIVNGDVELIMEGLRSEMQVSQGRLISHREMVALQKGFIATLVPETACGQSWLRTHTPIYLAILEQYALEVESIAADQDRTLSS